MARKPAQIEQTQDDDDTLSVISLEGSLADVEKPQNLPAGKYPGTIVDVQPAKSGKGNTYYAISFQIDVSDFPEGFDEDNAPEGLNLFYNRIIRPRSAGDRRALWNLKSFIRAIGLDDDVSEIDINDWMGQRALLRTNIDRYNGEDRAQIVAIEALDEGGAGTKRRATKKAVEEEEVEEVVEERKPARRTARR